MTGATLADLGLLVPELILVGMALALLLLARRLRASRLAEIGTVLAAVAGAVASAWVLSSGPRTGFGGMLTVDGYSQFFKVLIAGVLGVAALLSVRTSDIPRAEYNALLLLAGAGMMQAVSALDLLSVYLALEVMTLSSCILVGITVERPASNEAAIKYFLIASFASALLLYGISLTYGLTGSTGFAAIASAITERGLGDSPLLLMAMGLLAAGLAFKIAAVPFHAWAPDAYQGAATPVAAFLASGSKAVGLAALGRICLVAFGPQSRVLAVLLVVLAGLSMVVGSLIILAQTDMRRLLAYSSIAHVGYALLGLSAGTPGGASATMTYAFFYAFMTLGAFGVVIAVGERGRVLDGFRGLATQRPGLAALMLLFLLALTGIPPTAGFVAKFVVIASAVEAGYVAVAILAVACSVVTAFLYMRVAVLMYMTEPEESAPPRCPVPISVALAVSALVTLVGGILPGTLAPWAASP